LKCGARVWRHADPDHDPDPDRDPDHDHDPDHDREHDPDPDHDHDPDPDHDPDRDPEHDRDRDPDHDPDRYSFFLVIMAWLLFECAKTFYCCSLDIPIVREFLCIFPSQIIKRACFINDGSTRQLNACIIHPDQFAGVNINAAKQCYRLTHQRN
jgi:hypothetical protein